MYIKLLFTSIELHIYLQFKLEPCPFQDQSILIFLKYDTRTIYSKHEALQLDKEKTRSS